MYRLGPLSVKAENLSGPKSWAKLNPALVFCLHKLCFTYSQTGSFSSICSQLKYQLAREAFLDHFVGSCFSRYPVSRFYFLAAFYPLFWDHPTFLCLGLLPPSLQSESCKSNILDCLVHHSTPVLSKGPGTAAAQNTHWISKWGKAPGLAKGYTATHSLLCLWVQGWFQMLMLPRGNQGPGWATLPGEGGCLSGLLGRAVESSSGNTGCYKSGSSWSFWFYHLVKETSPHRLQTGLPLPWLSSSVCPNLDILAPSFLPCGKAVQISSLLWSSSLIWNWEFLAGGHKITCHV